MDVSISFFCTGHTLKGCVGSTMRKKDEGTFGCKWKGSTTPSITPNYEVRTTAPCAESTQAHQGRLDPVSGGGGLSVLTGVGEQRDLLRRVAG